MFSVGVRLFFCFVLGSITSLYVICLLLLFGSLRDWFDGELMFFVILLEVRRLPPFLPDFNHVPYPPNSPPSFFSLLGWLCM